MGETPDLKNLTNLEQLDLVHMKEGAYLNKLPASLKMLRTSCSHMDPSPIGFLRLTNLTELKFGYRSTKGTAFKDRYTPEFGKWDPSIRGFLKTPIHEQLKADLMKHGLQTAASVKAAVEGMMPYLELFQNSGASLPGLSDEKIQYPIKVMDNVGALLLERLTKLVED